MPARGTIVNMSHGLTVQTKNYISPYFYNNSWSYVLRSSVMLWETQGQHHGQSRCRTASVAKLTKKNQNNEQPKRKVAHGDQRPEERPVS